jgi:hypothetical protein
MIVLLRYKARHDETVKAAKAAKERAAAAAREEEERERQEFARAEERRAREEIARRKRELAESIADLRVSRFGEFVTVYRCPCFFLRAEIDPFDCSVTFDWRFDLWKRVEHSVRMWMLQRGAESSSMRSDDRSRVISQEGRSLATSTFRRGFRMVPDLRRGEVHEFLIRINVPEHSRSFVFEAIVPSEEAVKGLRQDAVAAQAPASASAETLRIQGDLRRGSAVVSRARGRCHGAYGYL